MIPPSAAASKVMRDSSILLFALLVIAGPACSSKEDELSSSNNLLKNLDISWQDARETLSSAEPNYNLFSAIRDQLFGPFDRQLRTEYPDRPEVMERFEALQKSFTDNVMAKLNIGPRSLPKPKTNVGELRKAFEKVDVEYQALRDVLNKDS